MEQNYLEKYLKYKNKYLNLKNTRTSRTPQKMTGGNLYGGEQPNVDISWMTMNLVTSALQSNFIKMLTTLDIEKVKLCYGKYGSDSGDFLINLDIFCDKLDKIFAELLTKTETVHNDFIMMLTSLFVNFQLDHLIKIICWNKYIQLTNLVNTVIHKKYQMQWQ